MVPLGSLQGPSEVCLEVALGPKGERELKGREGSTL